MVQVNLLSKKRGLKKRKNMFLVGGTVLFSIVAVYFFLQVTVVIARYISVNSKLKAVRTETSTLSAQILKNNEKLNNFILTKFVLGKIISLRAKQFDYSAYLDEVQRILPEGNQIIGVDFVTSGYMNIKILSSDSSRLASLEKSVKTTDLTKTEFSSVAVLGMTRNESAVFRSDLLFGIKTKNASK